MDRKVISVDDASSSSNNVSNSHKAFSVESRLRLKRTNRGSANNQRKLPEGVPKLNDIHTIQDTQEATEEHRKEDIPSTTLHSTENDSILDFKSPEAKKLRSGLVKAKLSKFKSSSAKQKKGRASKFNVVINNHQEVKADARSKKRSRESQPSIEASFFKSNNDVENKDISADVKTALVCPLCFKACKDVDSQALHMKNCAAKNNVSTKKLLDALELQKRQASERELLGLLAAPVVQDKKKSAPRKANAHEDADLELALALSRSLHEVQESNDYNAAEGFLGTSDSFAYEKSEPVYVGQLETFGFANNKAVTLAKTRKRKLTELTVLQTRSDEERSRILTEKVSEILIGKEAITQALHESLRYNEVTKQKIVPRSYFLQDILRTEEKLWDKTRLTPGQKHFYVSELATHIPPCEESLQDVCEENVRTVENVHAFKVNEREEKHNVNVNEAAYAVPTDCVGVETEDCADEQFRETLVKDWANTLNDSSASDLIIFVRDGKHIWAHKLVIYVRCSTMLLDVTPNDHEAFARIKEKISLTDVSYHIALAFLEFIYCGTMRKYLHVLEDATAFSDLRNLARKYSVKELFAYLRKREASMKQLKAESDIKKTTPITEKTLPELNKIMLNVSYFEPKNEFPTMGTEKSKHENSLESDERISAISETMFGVTDLHLTGYNEQLESISGETTQDAHTESTPQTNVNCTNDISILLARSVSPDMFDDTDDAMNNIESNACKTPDAKKSGKDSNFTIPESVNWESEFSMVSQGGSAKHIDITSSPECSNDASTVSTKCNEESSDVAIEERAANTLDLLLNQTAWNSLAQTPPSRKLKRKSISFSGVMRQKSNLSLFIERVQKENARSDLDTDSELDSIVQVPSKLNRNPFNVNQHDHSDLSYKSRANATMETKVVKKNGLDVFDESIEGSELNESTAHEENEDEMGSRSYELIRSESLTSSNKTLNNSRQNSTPVVAETVENIGHNLQKSHILSRLANDTTLLSEADTDEGEVSMYARYKRKHRNNSIDKYRVSAKKYISNNLTLDKSNDSGESEADTIPVNSPCNRTEDVTVLSDLDVDSLDESSSPTKTHNSQAEDFEVISNVSRSKNMSAHSSMDSLNTECFNDIDNIRDVERSLRTDSPNSNDTEILIDDKETHCITPKITTPRNRQKRHSKTLSESQVNKLRHSKSESNISIERERTEALLAAPTFSEIDTHRMLESPVLVTSSPEFSMVDFNTTPVKEKEAPNLNTKNDESDINYIFRNEIFLANVRFDNVNNSETSPILRTPNSLEKRNADVIDNKDEGVSQSQRERKKRSENADKSVRKFGRKSMSEGNFSSKTASSAAVKSVKTFDEPQCKCGRRRAVKGPSQFTVVRDNVTPPPIYDTMKTPELHKELKRYGLKQQKRSRAVKLLTYIYNELHPVVSSATETLELEPMTLSSEDESPRRKILSQRSVEANGVGTADDDCEFPLSQLSTDGHSPVNIIAEEMQFDEHESVGITDSARSIKDVFLRLLRTNKELHNKILMYEPLGIESLHATIKSEGFKCKMNDLMDFLDEQCITFCVQENSGKSRTRKN